MHNANQIFRTPAWRKSDPDGALRIHPDDLAALGATDGGWMAVETRTGRIVARVEADASMRRGLVALPHGYGQAYPDGHGDRVVNGPRLNLITTHDDCDPWSPALGKFRDMSSDGGNTPISGGDASGIP